MAFGVVLPLAVLALGCSSETTALDDRSDAGSDASSGDASSTGLTLDTCETSVGADVPAFYARYFRCVTVTKTANGVRIASKALPPHRSNYYPTDDPNFEVFDSSRGTQYRANPNRLTEQNIRIEIPDAPTPKGLTVDATLVDGVVGTSKEEYLMGPVGVALDSVVLFNALAAPGDDIEAERFTFDRYNAHPAPNGAYHYHTTSMGPLEVLARAGVTTSSAPGQASVELYGILCDGTPILGCTELDGADVSAEPLDAQGGHVHDIRDKETTHFADRYHVHLCAGARTLTPEIQFYSSCGR